MLILLLKRDGEFVQMVMLHRLSCPKMGTKITDKTHSSSKPRTAQIVAVARLKKCCITSAYLQWLFHSGERAIVIFFPRTCRPVVMPLFQLAL